MGERVVHWPQEKPFLFAERPRIWGLLRCVVEGRGTMMRDKLVNPGVLGLGWAQLWPLTCLWTVHVWIYWFNSTTLRTGVASGPWWLGRYGVYGCVTLVMLGAALVFWRRGLLGLDRAGRFDLPMAGLMVSCTLSVMAARIWGPAIDAWHMTNALAAGVCVGWGYLRWSVVYANLGIRDAVACLFLSYLVGSTLKIGFDVAPAMVGAVAAALLGPLLVYALHRVRADGYGGAGVVRADILYHRGTFGVLWRTALCVLVFCLVRRMASMAMTGDYGFGQQLVGHGVEVGFAVAALAWVFGANRTLDFPQLWRFVFLFVATAVLIETLGAGNGWANLCNSVAVSLIVMVLWLVLSDVAHHCDMHPYVVFGMGWSLYVGPTYVGALLARGLGLDTLTAGGAVVLLWVLGVTMAFCLEANSPDVRRIFADLRTKVDPEEFATIDERCDQLARAYGLTEREIDVLKLLAKGRSKAFIAESLFISENTVRGHSRRLYAKLGVHTRDELQGLLGL